MKKNPMTVTGEKSLREELDRLKKVQRPAIINAIASAREHGDLKENAEYHAAREQQSFVEGRIQDIESKLSNAQVIDITKIVPSERVIFGCSVTITDLKTEKTANYQIVGDDEAEVTQGKISYKSPIARALIGRVCGDCVVVKVPAGDVEYEIEIVDYV
tara:strand:- start:72467 stop:72943 length:477 start_codon:yes stop_codon:yes gene_type:complete